MEKAGGGVGLAKGRAESGNLRAFGLKGSAEGPHSAGRWKESRCAPPRLKAAGPRGPGWGASASLSPSSALSLRFGSHLLPLLAPQTAVAAAWPAGGDHPPIQGLRQVASINLVPSPESKGKFTDSGTPRYLSRGGLGCKVGTASFLFISWGGKLCRGVFRGVAYVESHLLLLPWTRHRADAPEIIYGVIPALQTIGVFINGAREH